MNMTAKWIFKVSEVECIRAESYGDAYDATLTIKVVNGVCHVVRGLSRVGVNRSDRREIEAQIKSMGFNKYTISRNKNGTLVNAVKVIG